MVKMVNYRLGLCLAAIATVIVVVPTEGGLLDKMEQKSGGYQHRVSRTRSFRGSSSASSAAYSSGGDSQAAAGAAAGNGRSGSYAQGFASNGRNRRRGAPPQPVYYDEPAQFEDYDSSSEAASGAGFGGSFANAQAQSAYGYSGADASAYSQDRFRPKNRRPVKNAYTAQRRSPPPAPDTYRPSSPSVPTAGPEKRFANGPSVSSSIAATSGGIAAAGAAGNAGSSTSATVSSGGPRAGQHASARSGNNRRPGRSYGRPEEYYDEHNRQEPYRREGSVASSVASARTSPGPASAAMASAQHDMHEFEDEEEEESFSVPETVNEFSSRAGSYADDGNFQESGSYVRAYEDDQSYEQGDEEGDSYFGAKSYGKAYDAHIDEVSHEKNEDTFQGDNFTHTKKNSVFKKVKGKISDHETGSSVKGKDKYRAQYGRGNRRVRDYVDQGFNRNSPGAVSDNHLSEVSGFDEETDDSYDSRGMGNFPRRRGPSPPGPSQPGPSPRRQNLAAKAAAAAAAASATASSAGVTSSTSAAKN